MSRSFQMWAEVFETCAKGEAEKSKVFLKGFRKEVKQKEAELNSFRQMKEQEL
jgi:hypothetical protein